MNTQTEASIGYEIRETRLMRIVIMNDGFSQESIVDGLCNGSLCMTAGHTAIVDHHASLIAEIVADDSLEACEYNYPRNFTPGD